jgi:hypothetical protein
MPQVPAVVQKYAKAVVAIGGAVLTVVNVIAGGGDVPQIIVAVITALGVLQVKNKGH